MTEKEFMDSLLGIYQVVKVLSHKNGSRVYLMRNNTVGGSMVVRFYEKPVAAYNKLIRISHPNLPEIYDVYELDDVQVVFEEYVDGITVEEVLEGGRYTYSGVKKVIRHVGYALEVLHGMNIIHRDIKPGNIIISKDGAVKLIDLNASREYVPERKTDTVVLGTVGYASPEQYGISQSGTGADIYALGVLLNVMLTGKHPSEKLAGGKAGRIVLKCTQIDPERRFGSVEKLIHAL